MCSKLIPEHYWHCSGVSIANFEHISHLLLVFLLLTLVLLTLDNFAYKVNAVWIMFHIKLASLMNPRSLNF